MSKKGGWFRESLRHSFAARGLKTGTKTKKDNRIDPRFTPVNSAGPGKKTYTVVYAWGGIADYAEVFTKEADAEAHAQELAKENGFKSVDELNESEDQNIWVIEGILQQQEKYEKAMASSKVK